MNPSDPNWTPNLGGTPHERAFRDAVHIAVAPVVAGENLDAGQWVRLDKEGRAVKAFPDRYVGIVDPFRVSPVSAGEAFWLLVRPGTVTSLRHAWTHPGFGVKGVTREERP